MLRLHGLVALASVLPWTLAQGTYCDVADTLRWDRIGLSNVADRTQCEKKCDEIKDSCSAISFNAESNQCALLRQPVILDGVTFQCNTPQNIQKRVAESNCIVATTGMPNTQTTTPLPPTKTTCDKDTAFGITLTSECPSGRSCVPTTCADMVLFRYGSSTEPGWACPNGYNMAIKETDGTWTKIRQVRDATRAILFTKIDDVPHSISAENTFACPKWDRPSDNDPTNEECKHQTTC